MCVRESGRERGREGGREGESVCVCAREREELIGSESSRDNHLLIYGAVDEQQVASEYRGTSLTRKRTLLGPYRRPMPRVLGGVLGCFVFLLWARQP